MIEDARPVASPGAVPQQQGEATPPESIAKATANGTGYLPANTRPKDYAPKALKQYSAIKVDEGSEALTLDPKLPLFRTPPPMPSLEGVVEGLQKSMEDKMEPLGCFLNNKQYKDGISYYHKFRPFFAKQGLPELTAYFDSFFVLFSLNSGDLSVIQKLPADTPEAFIHWHLDIAANAASGSDSLNPSRELELYCLRKAADAGSPIARQALIRQLLFGQKSSEPELYLPEEAFRYIRARAKDGSAVAQPEAMGDHDNDTVTNKLIELAATPSESGRQSLARELLANGDPRVQMLAVALYVEPIFGLPEPETALAHLGELDRTLKASPEEKVYQEHWPDLNYWQAKALLLSSKPGSVKQAEELLEQAKRAGSLCAMQCLGEHYLSTQAFKEVFEQEQYKRESLLGTACRKHLSRVLLCPDLAYTLSVVGESARTKSGLQPREWLKDRDKTATLLLLYDAALKHDSLEARSRKLYQLTSEKTQTDNLRAIGTEKVERLPASAKKLLQQYCFSQDPQTLVFIYLDQLIETGQADEQLISQALAADPVATCCQLLVLDICSETMLHGDLLQTLLTYIDQAKDLPVCWLRPTVANTLYYRMSQAFYQLRDPEKCLRVASQLKHGATGTTADETGIHDQLQDDYARYLSMQGKVDEADHLYRVIFHKDLKKGYCSTDETQEKVPDDYKVLHPDLLDHYWAIDSFNCVSLNPAETRGKFKRIIAIHTRIADDPNPAIHEKWLMKCQEILQHSSYHLSTRQVQTLWQEMQKARNKVQEQAAWLFHRSKHKLNSAISKLDPEKAKAAGLPGLQSELETVPFPSPDSCDETSYTATQCQKLRLPGPGYKSHLTVHHLEGEMIAAKTSEERLNLLQQCLDSGTYNTPVIIALTVDGFDELPEERQQQAAKCLLTLGEQLVTDMNLLREKLDKFDSEQIPVIQKSLEVTKDTEVLDEAWLNLEKIKADLARRDPDKLINVMKKGFISKEKQLYSQAVGDELPLEEQFYLMQSSLRDPVFFRDYAAYLAAGTPREELGRFCKVVKKTRGMYSEIDKLFVDYLQGAECQSLILKIIANTRIGSGRRMAALSIGYRLGMLNEQDLKNNALYFSKPPIDKEVVLALAASTGQEMQKCYDTITAQEDLGQSCPRINYKEMGIKCLKMGNMALADQCFQKAGYHFGQAMMLWKHLSTGNQSQVLESLCQAASEADVLAQCRLADVLLCQGDEGAMSVQLARMQCWRYLFVPNLIPSDEKLLYQGVVQCVGLGCTEDIQAGAGRIVKALESPSPLPALRLVHLVHNGHIAESILPFDCAVKLAEKLECYTGNLVEELRLSDSKEDWGRLLQFLEEKAGKASEPQKRLLYKATQRLHNEISPPEVIVEQSKPKASRKKVCSQKRAPREAVATSKTSEAISSKDQAQRAIQEAEESVITKLSSLLLGREHRSMKKELLEQQMVALLRRLKLLQGRRFPDMDQGGILKLLNNLPLKKETHELAVALFSAIDITGRPSRHDIFTDLINRFMLRYDLEQKLLGVDPSSFDDEKRVLLHMLPVDLKVTDENQQALLTLADSYLPELPERLEGFLSRPENLRLLQRFLIKHPAVTPASHKGLYLSYWHNTSVSGAVLGGAHIDKAESELQMSIFDNLAHYSVADIKRYIIDRPLLSAIDKVKLFMKLELSRKQKLLEDRKVCSVICDGIYEDAANPRHRLDLVELRQRVHSVTSSVETLRMQELLTIYVGLINENQVATAGAILTKIKEQADLYLKTPLKDWKGDKERLYAMTITGLTD